jgi:hypothetical protein
MPRGIRIDPTVTPSETDKAWAAGFVDGEGCITVRCNRSNLKRGTQGGWYASLTVSQVDITPLEFLRDRWGGPLRPLYRRRHALESDAWEWGIVGQMFYRCMDDIRPYLTVKRACADNALQLRAVRRATGWGNAMTPEEIAQREAILNEARRLNSHAHPVRHPEDLNARS